MNIFESKREVTFLNGCNHGFKYRKSIKKMKIKYLSI